MGKNKLPLKEISIDELYLSGEKCIYEIPIYQRNYAWEKDEITTLIQDVYDSYKKDCSRVYYIGTLVLFNKGDGIFEVIDGQQRLTTIKLVIDALSDRQNEIVIQNRLTYRARKKSDETLKSVPKFDVEEKDSGIENGFKYARSAIGEIVPTDEKAGFIEYFKDKVHIIQYQVPRDIDLNHYFEVMNSRGEQLEKHEIVKANLMEELDTDEERIVFNKIWECCSNMNVYVQQNASGINVESVFTKELDSFVAENFEVILEAAKEDDENGKSELISIAEIISSSNNYTGTGIYGNEEDRKDTFLPIIDFSNFLLIVLKILRMKEKEFKPAEFNLDDKELLNEFNAAKLESSEVKKFAYLLIKSRFYLDNYIVHHSKEEDTMESNPWKVQVWHKNLKTNKAQLKNTCDDDSMQNKLVHLLSMFEVAFTARQRKNYLFYCIFYLVRTENKIDIGAYTTFVEELANRYFNEVYMVKSKLNAINTPTPGSFDDVILSEKVLNRGAVVVKNYNCFKSIYGDGTKASKGIPIFVFNYLDYRIWELYNSSLRGEKLKKESPKRVEFFEVLGCSDFDLKLFEQFYFSRTRRSLEHYYPQANANGEEGNLNQSQINCFGNYAMIGSEANSSGSNWSPKTKLDHYLDSSGKVSQISVASLKFMIMLNICSEKKEWTFEDIKEHQEKMFKIISSEITLNDETIEGEKEECLI